MTAPLPLTYSPEVAEARANNAAIVALESTIITHGMPYPQNLETARRVEAEVVRFADLAQSLPRPLVGVLLGGNSRYHRFPAERGAALGRELAQMARQDGAGLWITASRRTPPALEAAAHAVITAGLIRMIEACLQIRGDAGAHQIDKKIETAIAHGINGPCGQAHCVWALGKN